MKSLLAIAAALALGCAHRPPVLATAGAVVVNLGTRVRVDPLLGLAVPIQGTPFGVWTSATYNAEERTWGSVSAGVTILILPGKP